MEKNKKELKILSILILALVAFSLVRSIVNVCIKGFTVNDVPAGMSKDLVLVVTIIAYVISLLILLPQIYIGVKGIMIANGAESGKAHMIWAIILAVLAAVTVISATSNLFKAFSFGALLNVLDPATDIVVYVFYYMYARKIACK